MKQKTNQKTNKLLLFITDLAITLLLMAVIFRFSAQPAVESRELSDGIVYRVIVFIQKIVPAISVDTVSFLIRKCAHFSEYLILGFFMNRTILRYKQIKDPFGSSQKIFECIPLGFASFALATFYAIFDEVHQYFVPGRSCELRDMCIDALGVFIGVLISKKIRD